MPSFVPLGSSLKLTSDMRGRALRLLLSAVAGLCCGIFLSGYIFLPEDCRHLNVEALSAPKWK